MLERKKLKEELNVNNPKINDIFLIQPECDNMQSCKEQISIRFPHLKGANI